MIQNYINISERWRREFRDRGNQAMPDSKKLRISSLDGGRQDGYSFEVAKSRYGYGAVSHATSGM